MSEISSIGSNIGQSYERPNLVKEHLEAAKDSVDADSRVAARDQDIRTEQAEREQTKAPVVNGQGERLDLEA